MRNYSSNLLPIHYGWNMISYVILMYFFKQASTIKTIFPYIADRETNRKHFRLKVRGRI